MGWEDNDYDYNAPGDEGSWDNTDYVGMGNAQAGNIDYTQGSGGYTGQDYQGDWNSPYSSYDSNFNTGTPGWDTGTSGNMQFNQNPQTQFGQDYQQQPMQNGQGMNWGKLGTDALGNFAKSLSSGSTMQNLAGLFAASQTKKSNNQLAQQMPQAINQQLRQGTPFDNPSQIDPNSARAQALSGYQQSMASPYDPRIVSDQVAQTNALQARIDAKAGRRSNMAGSTPAAMATNAKIAMDYQKQLADQAGAGQFMSQSAGLSDLMRALQYGAQGNSPYFSALGTGLTANNYGANPNLQQATNANRMG